jgi:hypothetical protein
MDGATYHFSSELFEWTGNAAWHFFAVPEDVTDEIDEHHGANAAGFGSIKVEVTIGSTTWTTSLFPDTKRGCFLLPVKKAVRTAEDLVDGSPAEVTVRVLV